MNTASTRRQRDEEGYSLVELITIIIIIGLLASIAIPLYLDQQKKGYDAAAKSDLNVVAKLVASYAAENDALPTVTVSGTSVLFDGESVAALSNGVVLGALTGTETDDWCIDDTHPAGKHAADPGYKFSATEGAVEQGQCT